MNHRITAGLIAFTIVASTAGAQEAPDWERRYDCMLRNGPIVVDGSGDEFAWQLAPEVGSFTRFQDDDLTPRHRTSAKMLWDEGNLYILVAEDDADIWSTMTVSAARRPLRFS